VLESGGTYTVVREDDLGSLERRLEDLEGRSRASREAEEVALTRQVMRRLTDDELRTYAAILKRMMAGEVDEEAQAPILERVREVREEVRHERTTTG
jgi:hypothetical protein